MKLKQLEQWICDECGGLINCADDVYVEWLGSDEGHHAFRIVHN
jgi:hypothetical protein